jgi:hypothetical protein
VTSSGSSCKSKETQPQLQLQQTLQDMAAASAAAAADIARPGGSSNSSSNCKSTRWLRATSSQQQQIGRQPLGHQQTAYDKAKRWIANGSSCTDRTVSMPMSPVPLVDVVCCTAAVAAGHPSAADPPAAAGNPG